MIDSHLLMMNFESEIQEQCICIKEFFRLISIDFFFISWLTCLKRGYNVKHRWGKFFYRRGRGCLGRAVGALRRGDCDPIRNYLLELHWKIFGSSKDLSA